MLLTKSMSPDIVNEQHPPSMNAVLKRWGFVLIAVILLLVAILVAMRGGLALNIPDSYAPADRVNAPTHATQKFLSLILQLAMNLPLLIVFWLAAFGWGYPGVRILRFKTEMPRRIQLVLGLTEMLLFVWLSSWLIGINVVIAWITIAIGIGLLGWQLFDESQRAILARAPSINWWALVAVPAVALLLTAAMCPPPMLWKIEAFGYDVLSYHLQLPKEWLEAGRMTGLAHNVYSYLPSLGEVGFLHLSAMLGSAYKAVYLTQLFHASCALLTAAILGGIVAKRSHPSLGYIVGAIVIAMPWTLITGSMAYNEWIAMAMGAGALAIVLDNDWADWRTALFAGYLVGGATMCKLTAGPNVAVPIGLLLLSGLMRKPGQRWSIRIAIRQGAIAAGIGIVTLSPWLIRNTIDTGNPVFPFAQQTLSVGDHWTSEQAERWNNAHQPKSYTTAERMDKLSEHWLFSAGYGSMFGSKRERGSSAEESQNIARFDHEGGIPVYLLLVTMAAIAALLHPTLRAPAAGLLLVLAIQVGFWLYGTHLQSRFLVWSIIPTAVLLGFGLAFAHERLPRFNIALPLIGSAVVGCLTMSSFHLFFTQKVGGMKALGQWVIVDALPTEAELTRLPFGDALAGDHAINHLPTSTKTLLIADASRMLYVRGNNVYNSAFDQNLLGQVVRDVGGEPDVVLDSLAKNGITHMWVHWSELTRLRATYGYDPDVTPELLATMIETNRMRNIYELPPANQRLPGKSPSIVLYELLPSSN